MSAGIVIRVDDDATFFALLDALGQYVENGREALELEQDAKLAARVVAADLVLDQLSTWLVGAIANLAQPTPAREEP